MNLAHIVQDRSALRANEDVAIITMHWRSAVPGLPDIPPMDDTRRGNAKDKIVTFLTAIKAFFPTTVVWKWIYWYETPTSGLPAGPRIQTHSINVGGTGAGGPLPPQVACSVTFRTANRKNWGRFYLPSVGAGTVDNQGSLLQTWMDTIATAAGVMCDRGGTADAVPTVWSPTELTHHDPQQITVDDVLDVVRSRRYSAVFRRKIVTVG